METDRPGPDGYKGRSSTEDVAGKVRDVEVVVGASRTLYEEGCNVEESWRNHGSTKTRICEEKPENSDDNDSCKIGRRRDYVSPICPLCIPASHGGDSLVSWRNLRVVDDDARE